MINISSKYAWMLHMVENINIIRVYSIEVENYEFVNIFCILLKHNLDCGLNLKEKPAKISW